MRILTRTENGATITDTATNSAWNFASFESAESALYFDTFADEFA